MDIIFEVGLLQPIIIHSRYQVISGNRRLEWEEEEELLLKQRIKSFKELINGYLILDNHYRKGQGKRTDLTSVKS